MHARLMVWPAFIAIIASCSKGGESAADSAAPASVATLPADENYLAVHGGRIWYKLSGAGNATPAILLHGGPGFASYYMKPLEALSADRPVVRYDQLGAGNSDSTKDTTLFTIAHFVAELDSLRSRLGYDKVHLVGHSWGTILAVEYYRAHPEHVASLTLASPALDIPAWEKNARNLIRTLSDSAQRAIRVREAEKNFEAPDYQNALNEFYGKYVWRHPDPANLDSLLKTVNMALYNYMQGPSEFTITGTLRKYDVTGFLKDIKVPTLYTVGEFDEANPVIVKRFSSMTPGSRYEVLAGSGHMSEWDAPEAMNSVIRKFLRDVDFAASQVNRTATF
jgi:proline iminopeptidase